MYVRLCVFEHISVFSYHFAPCAALMHLGIFFHGKVYLLHLNLLQGEHYFGRVHDRI